MTTQGTVQAVNINDLKRYAPEARVNQPLLDSKDLVTRMNCYEPGQITPLHLHPHDDVGVALVFGAFGELLLLPTEEPRQVGAMRSFEIAAPEIVGLHHVKVAVEDQISVAGHIAPPRAPIISRSRGE